VGVGRGTAISGWSGRNRALAALGAGVALCLALAGWLWLQGRGADRDAHPQEHGQLALAGLAAPVRIDRNRHGVPQVEAGSERDAHFGLGFCQAQDRLGQLLALRSRAQGRAAERAGPSALDSDRAARLIDLPSLAERQWPALPSRTRAYLEAFAAGVNARIERIQAGEASAPPGWEAEALEPWRPQDSLLLFKLFAWNLGASVEVSLALQTLVGELGVADAQRFFPPRPAPVPALRSAGAVPSPGPVAAWLPRGLAALRASGGLEGFGVGSAAYVLGGAHTASGAPVLVAESHTAPTLPAPFYLAHLRAPGLDVAGTSLPGVPVFWSGRNAALAWGSVHAGAVVTDLYVETLRREAGEYHTGRSWAAVEQRSERIEVRGAEPVELVVRRTARGPLLPERLASGGEGIAVWWTGARVGSRSGIASLQAVARAQDGDDLSEALSGHAEPVVAVVWAHRHGGAGLQVAGWIPRRSLAARLLPLPGRAPWYQWSERVPFEDLPSRRLEAGEGFLVAADQGFPAGPEGETIDALWRPGVRARRLHALLGAISRDRPELRRVAALSSDLALPRSRELIDAALGLAGDAISPEPAEAGRGGDTAPGEEGRALAALLQGWDGAAAAESEGATAYHAFLDTLARELFAEPLGEALYASLLELPDLDLEGLVLGVLADARRGGAEDRWSDPERVRAAVLSSLRATWLGLAFRLGPDPRRWGWGGQHALWFRDPLGLAEPLGPFPMGGAPHAVFAGGFAAPSPFEVTVVASARLAVDLAAPDLMLTALAPGQSEHPGHAHYESGLPGWLSGRLALLATRRVEIDEYSAARLQLEPLQ